MIAMFPSLMSQGQSVAQSIVKDSKSTEGNGSAIFASIISKLIQRCMGINRGGLRDVSHKSSHHIDF